MQKLPLLTSRPNLTANSVALWCYHASNTFEICTILENLEKHFWWCHTAAKRW